MNSSLKNLFITFLFISLVQANDDFDWDKYINPRGLFINNKILRTLKGIDQYSFLTHITINKARLVDIENLRFLHNLISLNLESNSIINIESIGTLMKLIKLNLNKNKIRDINSLISLSLNLVVIELNANFIENINILSNLPNIIKKMLYLKR